MRLRNVIGGLSWPEGLEQIHELVGQLRGEAGARQVKGPRLGLAANSGDELCDDLGGT